jgi:membrane protein DedA with SNARE-associated domain
MDRAVEFFVRHDNSVLFAWIFAEQAGLPIPAVPLLLAAGAMANNGRIHLAWSLLLASAACLIADSFWYQMGRWHSARVLRLLHRISPAPDSCIRDVTTALRGHGAGTLLFAKFVPGLNFAAPPVAGLSGVSPLRFLLFDSLASVFWAGSYMVLGYTFCGQLEDVAAYSAGLPTVAAAILIAATAALITFRLLRNHRWLISPSSRQRIARKAHRDQSTGSSRSRCVNDHGECM